VLPIKNSILCHKLPLKILWGDFTGGLILGQCENQICGSILEKLTGRKLLNY